MRHARSGGTERTLDQLASALAASGHEPVIVCRSHVDPPDPRVRFEVLRPFAIGGAWRMWSWATAVVLFRARRRGGFDLVVGLGKTWSQDVMRLGGGVQRTYIELVHRSRGDGRRRPPSLDLKQRVACAIEDRALRPGAAGTWICNSEMVRRDVLRRFALEKSAVVVVHNGVDLERFHPRRRSAEGAALRRALASGLPVVTSDTNGAAELMTPGREGEVSSRGEDDEALAERLVRWLDRERIEVARPHARALAEEHSHTRAMRETLEVLGKAAARPR